jgi:hypothetical protein
MRPVHSIHSIHSIHFEGKSGRRYWNGHEFLPASQTLTECDPDDWAKALSGFEDICLSLPMIQGTKVEGTLYMTRSAFDAKTGRASQETLRTANYWERLARRRKRRHFAGIGKALEEWWELLLSGLKIVAAIAVILAVFKLGTCSSGDSGSWDDYYDGSRGR